MLSLMIDLETLSTAPNAVVTQLGWAVFDPHDPEEKAVARGCWHLQVEGQMARGHRLDWDTVCWWLGENEEARALLRRPDRELAAAALEGLSAVWREHRCQQVWGHGAIFDVTITEALFHTARMRPPWTYREVRDTRTLFWLAGEALVWPDNPVKHSAEHDAVCQAITVQRAIRLIGVARVAD